MTQQPQSPWAPATAGPSTQLPGAQAPAAQAPDQRTPAMPAAPTPVVTGQSSPQSSPAQAAAQAGHFSAASGAPMDPRLAGPQPPVPPFPAQPRSTSPLRGWLIAILTCLVLSLVVQSVTLALLVPQLITTTRPARSVTLVAISSGVASSVTVATSRNVQTEAVLEGQRVAIPATVSSDETVAIMVAASDPNLTDGRITCIITDDANHELVNTSAVVGTTPTVTCSWTNNGK